MRYDILEKEEIINDIQFFSLTSIDWSKFTSTTAIKYQLTSLDVERPWLLAHSLYGNVVYEDILFLINGIDNPLELLVGQEILVPSQLELQSFINKYA